MLDGECFRFTIATLSVDPETKKTVLIPKGEIVKISNIRSEHETRMVGVVWNGRILLLFAEDIENRCEQVAKR
jgi:hypothetical protein